MSCLAEKPRILVKLGTAVQIGANLASIFGKLFKLSNKETSLFLIGGIASGFGVVFGTPWAGAVFAIEVLVIGQYQFRAFLPSIASSLLAKEVVKKMGIPHQVHSIEPHISLTIDLIMKVIFCCYLFWTYQRPIY